MLSRRWSWFLVGFAVFSWIIWITFIRNIWKDERSFHHGSPQPFLIVHLVLTVVTVSLSSGVGWLGIKGLRAARQ
jgi:hypothetical protein